MGGMIVHVALREGELFLYKFTILYLVVQLGAIVLWNGSSGRRQRIAPRPPSDAFWFLPIFVWGLESLHHCVWWTSEAYFPGIGKTLGAFFPRVVLAEVMLGVTLCGCFLAENLAHRRGLAARMPQATLPLNIVAAIVGVQWTLGLFLLGWSVPLS